MEKINVIKEKVQEAFNAYKAQFDGLLSPEKEEAFANCFTVTVDDNLVRVNGIAILAVKEERAEQAENISHIVYPEVLDILLEEKITLRIFFRYENEQYLPTIAKVCLIREIYSE